MAWHVLFGVPAASDKSIGVTFTPGIALLSMHVGWPKFGRFLTSIEAPVDGGRTV